MLDKIKKEITKEYQKLLISEGKTVGDLDNIFFTALKLGQTEKFLSEAIEKAYKQGFNDAYEEATQKLKDFNKRD
jgi:flagellar biosynthesis/type III secretory pathway protein FliH